MTTIAGKLCLITGATAGIGKETALALARMRARLVLVARNRERGAATVAEVKAKTGNDEVEVIYADLSSMEAVRGLAADFKARFRSLDVLVNNAGAVNMDRKVTADGY